MPDERSPVLEIQQLDIKHEHRTSGDETAGGAAIAVAEVGGNPEASFLTHDHQLDFTLAETALKAGRFPYVGMIGSDTKAKRFRTRLAHRGFDDAAQQPLVTPVGNLSIPGKKPIEVAVSISAQIIALLNTPSEEFNRTITKDTAIV